MATAPSRKQAGHDRFRAEPVGHPGADEGTDHGAAVEHEEE
jgi:hypothetical protein